MKVLVTGGAGFIGSHLAEQHLLQDEVTVVDDLSTGSLANIAHLEASPQFRFVSGSVTDLSLMSELIESADVIYHLAAAVGVRRVLGAQIRSIETNLSGTNVVLQCAAKKSKRVLIASTSEVYGKRSQLPFREDDDLILGATCKGRWSYACSKAMNEFLALAYCKEKQVPVVIARVFNTVGPRQTGRYGMVIPTLVGQALAGQDMTVFGDGTQSRCFTHVADTVQALIGLAVHANKTGEVYNVGSAHEITILELAHWIKKLTASNSRIVMVPYEQAYPADFEDVPSRVPELTKLKRLIGYEPRISLEETLINIVQYQQSHPDKANGESALAMAG